VISCDGDGIRLLGTGALKAKLDLTVTHATKDALAAVEKAGGKVTVLPPRENKLATGKRAKKAKAEKK
jgi:large subunit ribosomal protein L15